MEITTKEINGYPDYFIDEMGNVFSSKVGKLRRLRACVNIHGYLTVCLQINGKQKVTRVHRLVAETFIPNPENKPQVNHKDGNKKNNCVSNLERATNKENMEHAFANGLHNSPPKAVQRWTLAGELVAEYVSMIEAERVTGTYRGNLRKVCLGKRNHAGGFKWRYKI